MRLFASTILCLSMAMVIGGPVSAQVAVPQVPLPDVGGVTGEVANDLRGQVDETINRSDRSIRRLARELERKRLARIAALVRAHPDAIALDANGAPARKGVLLAMGAGSAAIATATGAGFTVIGTEEIAGTGLAVTRLKVPDGIRLADAQRMLARLLPGVSVSADVLYAKAGGDAGFQSRGVDSASSVSTPVGMIDGAPAGGTELAALRSFAKGGGSASDHGSAVAGLLMEQGVHVLRAADVYGTDPAGGGALAITRALGWLAQSGSKVVSISLVGPSNPLLERAIGAVQREGVVIVAAVGNDGPAAPPAYPASYPGVVAVSGVDRHDRALIEAGRALHLDYVAPGADIRAPDAAGRWRKVRGTSFATPLVAARIAAVLDRNRHWRATLDKEARDLGPKGPDATYGRGLVCGYCGR